MSCFVSPCIYPIWDSLHFLDLIDYFLSHVGKVFDYHLFKNFLRLFLFLFFLDPYNSDVAAFKIVPDVSEIILSSFNCFSFILFFSSYFHHSISQLTYPFFCLSYSIDYFWSIFNLHYCVVFYCFFFCCCCCCCLFHWDTWNLDHKIYL